MPNDSNFPDEKLTFNTNEFPRVASIAADAQSPDSGAAMLALPRDSRAREVFKEAPALRHTVFMRAMSVAAIALLTACASTGSTYRSGVGDAMLERPPYYAGAQVESGEIGKVGHLPIAFQRGATQSPIFEPEAGKDSELTALLGEMNAYLASLDVSVALEDAKGASASAAGSAAVAPDVQFGCLLEGNLPGNDCVERGDSALGRGRQEMRLAVGRPSDTWIARTSALMQKAGAAHTLVITLELSQYLVKQSGWKGSKSVELGTGHVESLPWLTSLGTPLVVLQVTGALVDGTGKAVRIGAEGIAAQRTRLLVSSVGGQELFRDEEVKRARTSRREDIQGSPLAWQVALRQLVTDLTGRKQ